MSGRPEIDSAPVTPRPATVAPAPHVVLCPPVQYNSPSLSRAPLLVSTSTNGQNQEALPDMVQEALPNRTLNSYTPGFTTPSASPLRKALHLTKLEPQDAWLPITESRNGNTYYAAFHALCSGIGVQALILPVAFTILGWTWGIICLVMTFLWQLYTIWLLVHLHESPETGMRYSRYLQLCEVTFGEKLGKLLAMFPIMYLSGGTCIALIILGGSTLRTFFQLACGISCTLKPLTPVEWFLVFTCGAVVLSQLPNLNSIAGVSLVGALTAIGYCTLIWVVSVDKGRLPRVSYNPVRANTNTATFFNILNALGIIAFGFRGHNLILEIQATMPSSEKHPSNIPMWSGVKIAYLIIAMCIFPLAIGGYWAYGHMIPPNGGMLAAFYAFHSRDVTRFVTGLMSIFVIISSVTSFQIYAMPMFDLMEAQYVTRFKKPCSWWLRACVRAMFGFGCFFFAVAIPFLGSLAGLIGAIALPVTLAYPCFMWLKIKKPKIYRNMWLLNWGLGIIGMALSVILIVAGIYVIINAGIEWDFFNPQ